MTMTPHRSSYVWAVLRSLAVALLAQGAVAGAWLGLPEARAHAVTSVEETGSTRHTAELVTQDPRLGASRLATTTDTLFSDGFELALCGSPWSGWFGEGLSGGADTDCADCPSTTDLEAAILEQIEHKDDETCTVDIEIGSVTVQPTKLNALSVDVPEGVIVDSLGTSSCVSANAGADFLCRHNMVFDFTQSGSFDGSYTLHLQVLCDPALSQCLLCSGGEGEIVEFTLDGTNCGVVVVEPGEITGTVWLDIDGDGVRDPEDPPVVNSTGIMAEIYADEDSNGIPDGLALATSTTDENGAYGFGGLDGTYVLRVVGAEGSCQSSGPDSDIDANTGYTVPITVQAASPKEVVSGVDMGLTTVCH
jgi:hypothetical protein